MKFSTPIACAALSVLMLAAAGPADAARKPGAAKPSSAAVKQGGGKAKSGVGGATRQGSRNPTRRFGKAK